MQVIPWFSPHFPKKPDEQDTSHPSAAEEPKR